MNHLIDFQKKHGLVADGIIGKNTLNKMKQLWGIGSNQLAHLLANVHNETGGFIADTENLNYSAQGLANTWPSRYSINGKPNALAKKLANNPQAIANNAYASRNGNGSEKTGDGWKYRGRGGIQTTGLKNYRILAEYTKDKEVVTNPDIVATKYFWESALCYFTTGNLWGKMMYSDPDSVKAVRRAVNGGYIGLTEVQAKFNYYLSLM